MAKVPVNPEILRWARETAGLNREDAVRKLQLREARGISAVERLNALEEGEELPTRPLLLRMSKQYRRPLVAFYMKEYPQKGDRGEDYRRLPDDYTETDEALVDALLRDVRARQSIVRAALEDEEDAQPRPIVGASDLRDGLEVVAASIRDVLNFDRETFRTKSSFRDAFSYLRLQAESAGVFVLLIGDLGSHHTTIQTEIFRGFSIADSVAPFIVINDHDADAAWSFTLLHELTHISLGQTGISGAAVETGVERFCNDVAARLLLSASELSNLVVSSTTELPDAIEKISEFSSERNLSRAMVTYALFRNRAIDADTWRVISDELRREWTEDRAEQRKPRRGSEGGPNYYVVRRHRVGKALIEVVDRMVASGGLSSTRAGKVLGVRPKNVHALLGRTS